MDALRKALGALSAAYALVFFCGALLHAGLALGPLREPVIVPATVVETLCGAALAVGAYGALRPTPWAWDAVVYTHAGALAGVLMGVLAQALGPGEETALNLWYHQTMVVLLLSGLAAALYVSRVRR
ncbi:hypothetical protein [Nonomuraea rhizosphaerae]|uniref:hypothetical protein n=1 Tax=Nonomuraea rhizosphaerae TaxID=2665663 RepID=UPI001C5D5108|nr:hypothetical protein [Nonomuraea rhizosphaerae]